VKTIVIADVHGRDMWKHIIAQEQPDRVVFIGDYFDSLKIDGLIQIHNFKEIIEYKTTSGKEVILLIGNHDYHYFPEIGYTGTSGYQAGIAPYLNQVIDENRKHLQMAYKMGEFLFTHAGVGETWLKKHGWNKEPIDEFVNDIWTYKPHLFEFDGINGHGDDIGQTPIWIRPRSLMKDGQNLKKSIIQVVGHTWVERIDKKGGATGGRYYFVDTQETSKEYMIITDGVISFGIPKLD
jgi:predicted MPP superfamily phosphohydrolase